MLLATIGIIFADKKQSAYAMNRFCNNFLGAVGFAYSSYICVRHKLYIILVTVSLSLISYIVLEVKIQRESKKKRNESVFEQKK